MTYQEMLRRYRAIDDKAKRVRDLIWRRANRTFLEAGVSDAMQGHNVLCSYRWTGRPSPGVDYRLIRKARWIGDKSGRVVAVTSAAWSRLYDEWCNGGFRYD
jgi:protein involved in temperature-dependent protein secretion